MRALSLSFVGFVSFATFVTLAACGGGNRATRATPEIERLRARAESNPRDAAVWTELAEAELLGAGDAPRARAAIDHALSLSGSSPALHYLSALEHERLGKPNEAFDAYVRAIENARDADDDLSPVIAEVSLDAVHGLLGMVRDYDTRVLPLLREISEHPGKLGFFAVDAAIQRRILAARRRGEPDEATASAASLGCLREWRAAGPFGPYPMQTFDQTLAAEGRGALAERYDLGEGIGEQAVYEASENDCRSSFEAPEHRAAGSTIAETFVEVEHAGPHVLVIDTRASIKISVDGEETLVVDRRRVSAPAYTWVAFDLAAGGHEIEVKLTTRAPVPAMSITLDRVGRIEPGYDPRRGLELPEPTSILRTLIRALALRGRGGSVQAREAVASLTRERTSAAVLVVQQEILADDPWVPEQEREQLRHRLLQSAAERDPEAFVPAFYLALLQQGNERESYDALRAIHERWPEHPTVLRSWAAMQLERGLAADGEATLRRAHELVPDNCGSVRTLQELLRDQRRVQEANALVETLMLCNRSDAARLDLLARQRKWDEVRAELQRLSALWDEDRVRRVELAIAQATGDEETETRIRNAIADEAPDSEGTVMRHVDEALSQGRRARALELIDEATRRDPGGMHGLRRIRRDLTGEGELDAHRVDGLEVIRTFERSGRSYTQPSVLVWDYMVIRIYADGSSRHLIHQIHKIQSEEAIERFGQQRFSGDLLVLRSIKPDGRLLEPESIAGLDSIPMSELAIGDYVEYELVQSFGARANGSYLSGGWWFDNYDEPFDISKLVVIHPTEMEMTIEATGITPEPTRRDAGGLRTLTWMVQESEPPPNEPNAVPVPPFRSFLRFGTSATWESHFRAAYDALLDKDPRDPAVARMVAEIVEGASSPREKLARLHRWVIENIEEADAWVAQAPLMVHARSGHRARVLRYLLELAGLPAAIVLCRQRGGWQPGELSRDGIYSIPLIRIGGSEPLWATTAFHAPAHLLPQPLQGQEGVVLVDGLPRVRVPEREPADDRHAVVVDLTLDGAGARAEVRDEYHGAAGAVWRERIRSVPEAELHRVLAEAYVTRVFPGAEVDAIEVHGIEDWSEPFVIEYRIEVPSFGRRRGDETFLGGLFPTDLARSYGALATRQTSQLVTGFSQHVVMRVHGARGAREERPTTLTGLEGMTYSRRTTLVGDTLTLERNIDVKPRVVTTEDYPRFVRFARTVSQIEATEVAVRR